MKALILASTIAAGIGAAAQPATCTWDWPPLDVSCSGVTIPELCPGSYDACGDAVNSGPLFIGQPVQLGDGAMDLCAFVYAGSNGALGTWGWSAIPDTEHVLIFDAYAAAPLALDSLVIKCRSDDFQPAAVRAGIDEAWPGILATLPGSPFWTTNVLPLSSTIAAGSWLRVVIQAEPGIDPADGWWTDFVRVVAHPDTGTGVPDLAPSPALVWSSPLPALVWSRAIDVLGRPVNERAAAGVYVTGQRRVVVIGQ